MNPFTSDRWRPYIGAAIALCCGLLAVGVIWAVLETRATTEAVRATQLDNKSTLETAKQAAQAAEQTSDRIRDCTEPTGRCFEESQKRTGAVVKRILDDQIVTRHVSILAAACATDPELRELTKAERIDAIDLCVQAALVAEKR